MQIVFSPRFQINRVPDLAVRELRLQDAGLPQGFIRRELDAARAVINQWKTIFSIETLDETADFEDFFENAIQLIVALDLIVRDMALQGTTEYRDLSVHVLPDKADRRLSDAVYLAGKSGAFDPLRAFAFLGSPGAYEALEYVDGIAWPRYDQARAADRSYLLPSFPTLAGRLTVTATFAPDCAQDGSDLFVTAAEIAQKLLDSGKEPKILIKIVGKAKYANPAVFTAKTGADGKIDAKALKRDITEEFDYSLVNFEGRPRAFLVQEWVEMRREYRTVMVNGEILTGAGCIELATPLNNTGVAFDDMVEEYRKSGEIHVVPGFGERARKRATEIAAILRQEDPNFLHGTIDLYENPQGELHLVEANPFIHIGFYANDFSRHLPALINYAVANGPRPMKKPSFMKSAETNFVDFGQVRPVGAPLVATPAEDLDPLAAKMGFENLLASITATHAKP